MNSPDPDSNNPSDAAARRDENLTRARWTSRAERWFRALVQNSSDIIAIFEDDGTVRYRGDREDPDIVGRGLRLTSPRRPPGRAGRGSL